jgi:hypothetical protein
LLAEQLGAHIVLGCGVLGEVEDEGGQRHE